MERKFTSFFLLMLFMVAVSSCSDDDNIIPNWSNGSPNVTRAVNETLVYPTVSEIMADPTVSGQMKAAWDKTLEIASSSSRQEIGFYIYYDFDKKSYYIGDWTYGPKITGCEGTNASVSLGKVTNNLQVCAFFHTHTPLYYCPNTVSRITGPSASDKSFATSTKLPGLLYDYSAGTIYGAGGKGSSLYNSAKIYTFGVNQRPSMNI